jgi:hypothetical protein
MANSISRIKGILICPDETFPDSANDTQNAVFAYLLVLLPVYAVIGTLISVAGLAGTTGPATMPADMPLLLTGLVFLLFDGAIGTCLTAVWVHFCVELVCGKKEQNRTINATMYRNTPGFLFSWIPVIGPVFSLWSPGLIILGIRECDGVTTGQALMSIAIAVIVPLVILGILFLLSVAGILLSGTLVHP